MYIMYLLMTLGFKYIELINKNVLWLLIKDSILKWMLSSNHWYTYHLYNIIHIFLQYKFRNIYRKPWKSNTSLLWGIYFILQFWFIFLIKNEHEKG